MSELLELGKNAKEVSYKIAKLSAGEKNEMLSACADSIEKDTDIILEANEADYKAAEANGMTPALLDRLKLDEKRVKACADGIRDLTRLPDPVGEVLGMEKLPNGLLVGRKRVPMGVVGMIYEARPNVTSDAFGICFKSGNAVILRCGRDAHLSAKAITASIRKALSSYGLENAVQLIEDCSHEVAAEFMKMNDYLDVLIPRGGAKLIKTVVKEATVPVIETGTGNCHIYIDDSADLDMAMKILENAKTQRIGVCNAAESLVIHSDILNKAMPLVVETLSKHNVEIRCDERAFEATNDGDLCILAEEADFGTEYLDYIISVKTVDSLDEAIAHINHYNTGHSESIITSSYENAQRFLDEIDAACVYVNASTRFTDGGEFGFGAEIGISTQKLHARGPMGLKELTTYKYIIYGNGQIR